MASIMNRLLSAMNAHDLDAFVACFAADYESEQPAQPAQGVIVVGVQHDQIAWGRLYMEPIEQGGANIDEMVQETYRPSE